MDLSDAAAHHIRPNAGGPNGSHRPDDDEEEEEIGHHDELSGERTEFPEIFGQFYLIFIVLFFQIASRKPSTCSPMQRAVTAVMSVAKVSDTPGRCSITATSTGAHTGVRPVARHSAAAGTWSDTSTRASTDAPPTGSARGPPAAPAALAAAPGCTT